MPSILFEQPWVIGSVGAILAIATFYGWTQTGHAAAFKSGIILTVCTMLLIAFNLWYETDAEFLAGWLEDAAVELQKNDAAGVAKRIHAEHTERVSSILRQLPHVKFSLVKITRIHGIEVDRRRVPKHAEIRMNVLVHAESRGIPGKIPRWVRLGLEKEDDHWLITDFEDRDPQHEYVNSSSQIETLQQGLQNGR